VKIQPHGKDFVDAVQGQTDVLLTQAFKKSYSALTEDTSVALEIGNKLHMVHILDLEPAGGVRLIDLDMDTFFEFKVEFEKAPDLEFESSWMWALSGNTNELSHAGACLWKSLLNSLTIMILLNLI
jgi:hypothetical protein